MRCPIPFSNRPPASVAALLPFATDSSSAPLTVSLHLGKRRQHRSDRPPSLPTKVPVRSIRDSIHGKRLVETSPCALCRRSVTTTVRFRSNLGSVGGGGDKSGDGGGRGGIDYAILTPGVQPTSITGDDKFHLGSTYFSIPPAHLPQLDASAILNPGGYCRQSSWAGTMRGGSARRGTISGIDAAQRLVEGRRLFFSVVRRELFGSTEERGEKIDPSDGSDDGDGALYRIDARRRLYTLTGHGVPNGLFLQILKASDRWLSRCEADRISMRSVPGMKQLDRDRIHVTNREGIDVAMLLDPKYEYDLEMYMVVMHRMASRLASVMFLPRRDDDDDGAACSIEEEEVNENPCRGKRFETAAERTVEPAKLERWSATIARSEALPASLIPGGCVVGVGLERTAAEKGKDKCEYRRPVSVVVEWIPRGTSNRGNVVVRLQDFVRGSDGCIGAEKDRVPVSMVFDGVYFS